MFLAAARLPPTHWRGYKSAPREPGSVHPINASISAPNLFTYAGSLAGSGCFPTPTVDRIAVYMAGVLSPAGSKAELVAVKFSVRNLRRVAAGFKGSGNHLVGLLQSQLALGRFPCAFGFCRDDPEVCGAI